MDPFIKALLSASLKELAPETNSNAPSSSSKRKATEQSVDDNNPTSKKRTNDQSPELQNEGNAEAGAALNLAGVGGGQPVTENDFIQTLQEVNLAFNSCAQKLNTYLANPEVIAENPNWSKEELEKFRWLFTLNTCTKKLSVMIATLQDPFLEASSMENITGCDQQVEK